MAMTSCLNPFNQSPITWNYYLCLVWCPTICLTPLGHIKHVQCLLSFVKMHLQFFPEQLWEKICWICWRLFPCTSCRGFKLIGLIVRPCAFSSLLWVIRLLWSLPALSLKPKLCFPLSLLWGAVNPYKGCLELRLQVIHELTRCRHLEADSAVYIWP